VVGRNGDRLARYLFEGGDHGLVRRHASREDDAIQFLKKDFLVEVR
jgi:hypothetical protein